MATATVRGANMGNKCLSCILVMKIKVRAKVKASKIYSPPFCLKYLSPKAKNKTKTWDEGIDEEVALAGVVRAEGEMHERDEVDSHEGD